MYHPLSDELTYEDKLTDFRWLDAYRGPEIVMDPFQLEELQAQSLWEEAEEELDDWAPDSETPRERLISLGPWADEQYNEKGRKQQREEFWRWWNGQGDLIRDRLVLKDHISVDETIEYMVLIDHSVEDWHNHQTRPLFRNPPSMCNELSKEMVDAQRRGLMENRIAMGEFVRVRLKGIIHILPAEALVEYPQLKECLA
jgi:hypothetical protein